MGMKCAILNCAVAAFAGFFALAPAQASNVAQSEEALELLEELRAPDQPRWQRIERQIGRLWSRSGSASADLLLQRGREAMERGDTSAAIDHFSALIDHAPDFAEGYHARATAWFMDGRLGLAMDDLQQTLSLNPMHFSALAGVGRILEDIEAYDRAYRAYKAANAIHPHRDDVRTAIERLERRLSGTEI